MVTILDGVDAAPFISAGGSNGQSLLPQLCKKEKKKEPAMIKWNYKIYSMKVGNEEKGNREHMLQTESKRVE